MRFSVVLVVVKVSEEKKEVVSAGVDGCGGGVIVGCMVERS